MTNTSLDLQSILVSIHISKRDYGFKTQGVNLFFKQTHLRLVEDGLMGSSAERLNCIEMWEWQMRELIPAPPTVSVWQFFFFSTEKKINKGLLCSCFSGYSLYFPKVNKRTQTAESRTSVPWQQASLGLLGKNNHQKPLTGRVTFLSDPIHDKISVIPRAKYWALQGRADSTVFFNSKLLLQPRQCFNETKHDPPSGLVFPIYTKLFKMLDDECITSKGRSE